MEMNLAVSFVGNRNGGCQEQNDQNLIEGCNPIPSVQLRETRSSYFLDIDLPGLRRDDIWLQMDNTRKLIIRGQRFLRDMGMVGWTWHLVQRGGSRQRPFRIPRDVNVNAVSAHFRHGVLHIVMPKFRWSRFTPYEISGRPSEGSHLQLFPRIETILQGTYAHQAGQTMLQPRNIPCGGKKLSAEIAEIPDAEEQVGNMQEVDVEMEGQMSVVIALEEQSVGFPAEESSPSSEPSQRISREEGKEEQCDHIVSSSQAPQEERPLMEAEDQNPQEEGPLIEGGIQETITALIEGGIQETITAAPSHTSSVSDAGTEEGIALMEEDVSEKQVVEEKVEQAKVDNKLMGSETVADGCCLQQEGEQGGLKKGFSNLFSSIAAIATLKWKRG